MGKYFRTPEEVEEEGPKEQYKRNTLRFLVELIRREGGISKLSEKLGVQPKTLYNYLDKREPRTPSGKVIERFKNIYGLAMGEVFEQGEEYAKEVFFSQYESRNDSKRHDVVYIPFKTLSKNKDFNTLDTMPCKNSILSEVGDPESMFFIKHFGDDMAPNLPDWCTVVVDQSQTEIVSKRIYFIKIGETYRFVRMIRKGKTEYWASLDNELFEDFVLKTDEFEVIGKGVMCFYFL